MKNKKKQGMTLLEVVIAVAIAAVCLSAALCALTVIRKQMEKNQSLGMAKEAIKSEEIRIKAMKFSELNTEEDNLIILGEKDHIFHAFSDISDKRTEYFAAYNELDKVVLTNKSKYYLHSDYGDRIKVYKDGTELIKTINWKLKSDYQTITFHLSIDLGNEIKVEYLPSFTATEAQITDCFSIPDAGSKKTLFILSSPVTDSLTTTVKGGFEAKETIKVIDFKNTSINLSKEVDDSYDDFPSNPEYVKGKYPPDSSYDTIDYTLESNGRTITFISPQPPAPEESNRTEEFIVSEGAANVILHLQYTVNTDKVSNPYSVKWKDTGDDISYTLSSDKTITLSNSPLSEDGTVVVKYTHFAFSKEASEECSTYDFEIKYLPGLSLLSQDKYLIKESPENNQILFDSPQPENDPPVYPEIWPYHIYIRYIPAEIAGPPLTNATLITQIREVTDQIKKVSISVYPKNQLNVAPIAQSIFYLRKPAGEE